MKHLLIIFLPCFYLPSRGAVVTIFNNSYGVTVLAAGNLDPAIMRFGTIDKFYARYFSPFPLKPE